MATKTLPEQMALRGIVPKALTDPDWRSHSMDPKAHQDIFQGTSQSAKQGSPALHRPTVGWQGTGEFEGKGNSRKELYRITAAGIRAALENDEVGHAS